jgi:protein-tyrosine-phosphatase
MSQKLIVFVCRGNIARSVFAEAIAGQLLAEHHIDDLIVDSRGIQGTAIDTQPVAFSNITHYDQLYREVAPIFQKFSINPRAHKSQVITEATTEEATLLIALDNHIASGLKQLFPKYARKVHLISELVHQQYEVTDPERTSGVLSQQRIFRTIYQTLKAGLPTLVQLARSISSN